jgi:hypothetical protein
MGGNMTFSSVAASSLSIRKQRKYVRLFILKTTILDQERDVQGMLKPNWETAPLHSFPIQPSQVSSISILNSRLFILSAKEASSANSK